MRASMNLIGWVDVSTRPGETSVTSCIEIVSPPVSVCQLFSDSRGAAGLRRSTIVPSDPYAHVQSRTHEMVWSAALGRDDSTFGAVLSLTSITKRVPSLYSS